MNAIGVAKLGADAELAATLGRVLGPATPETQRPDGPAPEDE